MSQIDFNKYSEVDEIITDIKSVKIQGATNVAIATFEGIKLFINKYDNSSLDYVQFIRDLVEVANKLANARPNEPLAQNGVKYLIHMLKTRYPEVAHVDDAIKAISILVNEYLALIQTSKLKIIENSRSLLNETHVGIMTHCHSSTAENVIIDQANRVGGVKVVCTETRPLFQGRITAANLLAAGLDTTLIADSAAESFIIDKAGFDINIVFVGCDEITVKGDLINKIGSWGLSLAAYFASKPLYVVTSILKVDVSTLHTPVEIEMRESREIWPEAPEGLKLVNPSFEQVDHKFITGFITEVGILKPEEILPVIQRDYGWLF